MDLIRICVDPFEVFDYHDESNIAQEFVRFLRSYDGFKIKIKIVKNNSEYFLILIGLYQGSNFSLFLFVLTIK